MERPLAELRAEAAERAGSVARASLAGNGNGHGDGAASKAARDAEERAAAAL